jgi:hypothetical protein
MSNILNVKIICLVWFLLFRSACTLREVAGGMLGLSGKEETVRINHLPELCRTQTNVESGVF